MKAKDLVLRVVNELEDGKFEFKEFKPYMTYESFIGCILGDAEILRPTGFIDVKGKEIYEGHIVRDNAISSDRDYVYEIIFEEGAFITKWLGDFDNYLIDAGGKLEIIGDIFNNPELL